MKRKLRRERQGNIVVLSAFLMIVMMALAAFAVDVGYIAEARTQLQKSADASALAAAAKLPSLASATFAATGTATLNKTTITPSLKSSDIVYGWWDRQTATFYSPKPVGRPYNAVKITLRRTAANGNPLGLFFGRVLGTHTTDVTATAIGFGDRGLCGPFIGIEGASADGNVTTDSFDSMVGEYDSDTAGNNGSLCSDGPITVAGDATINGDVRAGEGETVTINGNADITGEIGNRTKQLNLPSVDPSAAEGNNNNSSLTRYRDPLGGGWIDPIDHQGDFSLEGGIIYDLPPGTYYFRDMKMTGNSQLNISGSTKIYVTGEIDFHGGTAINNNTGLANNLWINVTGPDDAKINGGTELYGVIYAPDSDVAIRRRRRLLRRCRGQNAYTVRQRDGSLRRIAQFQSGAYALRVMLVD